MANTINLPPPLPDPFPGENPYTGLTGSLAVATGEAGSAPNTQEAKIVAYISGMDLTLEKDIIEILSFGMEFKGKVPAIKDWNVSIDGTVALAKEGTQREFFDAFSKSSLITVGILLDEHNYFVGTGYVSSFNISSTPDDKVNLTSEIAGNGALILTLDDEIVDSGGLNTEP
jgi:predicted secreted protein